MSTSEICMDILKNHLTTRYKAQSCVSAYLMRKANCGRWQWQSGWGWRRSYHCSGRGPDRMQSQKCISLKQYSKWETSFNYVHNALLPHYPFFSHSMVLYFYTSSSLTPVSILNKCSVCLIFKTSLICIKMWKVKWNHVILWRLNK